MTITALPTAPSRARPATFSAEADALLSALPTMVDQFNAAAYGESAASLAVSLAALTGPNLVGFRPDQTYAADKIGSAVKAGAFNLDWYAYLVPTTDWTAALQAALNTNRNVIVPESSADRVISSVVTYATNNQDISGTGYRSCLAMSGSFVMLNADGKTGCTVRFMRLKGPGTPSAIANSYLQCGFRALTATRCHVLDCHLDGWAGGAVFIQDGTSCRVQRNYFANAQMMPLNTDVFGAADCVFWGSSVNCRFEDNESVSGSGYGCILQTVTGSPQTALRNKIRGNTVVGAKVYGIMVYNIDSSVHVIESTDVSHNTIRDVYGFYRNPGNVSYPASGTADYGAAIYILQAEKTSVIGNIIENCCINTDGQTLTPAGIGINSVSSALVEGNQIKTSAYYGIMVVDTNQQGAGTNAGTSSFEPSGYVIIKDNTVQATTRHGIYIKNKHNVAVHGNAVRDIAGAVTSQSGIVLEVSNATLYPTMRRISFVGNAVRNITNTSGSGLLIGLSTGTVIAHNQIENVANTGIFSEVTDGTLNANNVRSATTRGIDLRSTGGNTSATGNTVTASGVGVLAGHRALWSGNDIRGNTTDWSGTYAYLQTAMPTAGTWTINDVVERTTKASGQPWGWQRLTTGSAHVLNTDWIARTL